MSVRDKIKLTTPEIDELLRGRHVMSIATLGRTGHPHLIATWYAFLDGAPAFWTYGKSQKVVNLRRDPRISAMVEDGEAYHELRGVSIEGKGRIIEDPDIILQVGAGQMVRYGGVDEVTDEMLPMLQMQARKRVVIRIEAEHYISWDHRKLAAAM